jgi:hypothetical protein
VRHTASLPSFDWVIWKSDNALIESISAYAKNFIVNEVGATGGLQSEWHEQNWYNRWDFLRNRSLECIHNIADFKVVNDGLKNIGIMVGYTIGGAQYYSNFSQVDKTLANSKLDRSLIGSIFDFFVSRPRNSDEATIVVSDDSWNRILMGNLNAGEVSTTQYVDPNTNQRIQTKPLMKPQALGCHMAGSGILVADRGLRQIHAYAYGGGLPITSGDNLYQLYDSPISNEWPIAIPSLSALSLRVRHEENGQIGYPWRSGLFVSRGWGLNSVDLYPLEMILMDWNAPLLSIKGYEYSCESGSYRQDWQIAPIANFDYAYDSWTTTRPFHANVIGFGLRNRVVVTKPGYNLWSSYPDPVYVPAIAVSDLGQNANICMITRTKDNDYLVSDKENGLIHQFDGYSGRYVCSFAKTGLIPFQRFVGARTAVSHEDTTRNSEYEIYTAEQWSDTTGFRRYLPIARIFDVEREENGIDLPSTLKFGLCNAAIISISSNGTVFYSDLIVDSGDIKVNLASTYGDTIQVVVVPEGNPNYGSFGENARAYYIAPNGDVTMSKNYQMASANEIDVDINPNPVNNKAVINIQSQNDGFAQVSIYNSLGQLMRRTESIVLVAGLTTHYIEIDNEWPKGVYFVAISSNKFTRVSKFVVLR